MTPNLLELNIVERAYPKSTKMVCAMRPENMPNSQPLCQNHLLLEKIEANLTQKPTEFTDHCIDACPIRRLRYVKFFFFILKIKAKYLAIKCCHGVYLCNFSVHIRRDRIKCIRTLSSTEQPHIEKE